MNISPPSSSHAIAAIGRPCNFLTVPHRERDLILNKNKSPAADPKAAKLEYSLLVSE